MRQREKKGKKKRLNVQKITTTSYVRLGGCFTSAEFISLLLITEFSLPKVWHQLLSQTGHATDGLLLCLDEVTLRQVLISLLQSLNWLIKDIVLGRVSRIQPTDSKLSRFPGFSLSMPHPTKNLWKHLVLGVCQRNMIVTILLRN